jgi:hypothetical protein
MPLCRFRKLTTQIRHVRRSLKRQAEQNIWNRARDKFRNLLTDFEESVLRKPLLFWVDAFCVPAGKDKGVLELKLTAISHMTPTYAGAEWVLVLDAELEQTPSSVSYEEILARVLISS